jgi:hypothetical protein
MDKREAGDLLGDFEPPGSTLMKIGKFIAVGLDDPLHLTTVTGAVLYGLGAMMHRRSPLGIRRSSLLIIHSISELRSTTDELRSLAFLGG